MSLSSLPVSTTAAVGLLGGHSVSFKPQARKENREGSRGSKFHLLWEVEHHSLCLLWAGLE